MAILAAHEVGRCSVRSPYLDDLGGLVGGADDPAVYVQPVTYRRSHGHSLPEVLLCIMYLPGRGRKREACSLTKTRPFAAR
jgi:hypothetical protein